MKCECGNNEFSGHQQVYVDVVVDEHGNFDRNLCESIEDSIYEAGRPYGPFTCTKCGKEYEDLR